MAGRRVSNPVPRITLISKGGPNEGTASSPAIGQGDLPHLLACLGRSYLQHFDLDAMLVWRIPQSDLAEPQTDIAGTAILISDMGDPTIGESGRAAKRVYAVRPVGVIAIGVP